MNEKPEPAIEAQRRLFEKWRRDRYGGLGLGRKTEPGYANQYDDPFTQAEWRGWQASAITHALLLKAANEALAVLESLDEAELARHRGRADAEIKSLKELV